MSVTRFTEFTISVSVDPDRFDQFGARVHLLDRVLDQRLDLLGRRRTPLGQVARPPTPPPRTRGPARPRRAASTAAFRARRLVWNAISSMAVMISAIFLLDWLMASIASTALPTTWPPFSATSFEPLASCRGLLRAVRVLLDGCGDLLERAGGLFQAARLLLRAGGDFFATPRPVWPDASASCSATSRTPSSAVADRGDRLVQPPRTIWPDGVGPRGPGSAA